MTPPYQPQGEFVLPAGYGRAIRVRPGTLVRIVNPHGTQAVDFWAFNADDLGEYLSTDDIRSVNSIVLRQQGRRARQQSETAAGRRSSRTPRPAITTRCLCACNAAIYASIGVAGYHRSCADNLHEALGASSGDVPFTPAPLNLFMSVPCNDDGTHRRGCCRHRSRAPSSFSAPRWTSSWRSPACPQDVTTDQRPGPNAARLPHRDRGDGGRASRL